MKKRFPVLLLCTIFILSLLCSCVSASVKEPKGKLPASLDDPDMLPYLDQCPEYVYYSTHPEFLTSSEKETDDAGNVISWTCAESKNGNENSDIHVFSLDGNTLKYTHYYFGELWGETLYQFHENGVLGLVTDYYGEELGQIDQYDDSGLIQKSVRYKGDLPLYVTAYTYDDEGRLSSKITKESAQFALKGFTDSDIYNENKVLFITDYYYEYEGNSVLLYKQYSYSGDRSLVSKTTASVQDGSTVTEEENYEEQFFSREITDADGHISFRIDAWLQSDTISVSRTEVTEGTQITSKYFSKCENPDEPDYMSVLISYVDSDLSGMLPESVEIINVTTDINGSIAAANIVSLTSYVYDSRQVLLKVIVSDQYEQNNQKYRQRTFDAEGNLLEEKQVDNSQY